MAESDVEPFGLFSNLQRTERISPLSELDAMTYAEADEARRALGLAITQVGGTDYCSVLSFC